MLYFFFSKYLFNHYKGNIFFFFRWFKIDWINYCLLLLTCRILMSVFSWCRMCLLFYRWIDDHIKLITVLEIDLWFFKYVVIRHKNYFNIIYLMKILFCTCSYIGNNIIVRWTSVSLKKKKSFYLNISYTYV